jgi:agmatinase
MYMIKNLIMNLPVKALDLVEISPPRDVNDITSWAGLKIIYEIFGTLYKIKNPDAVKLRKDCF